MRKVLIYLLGTVLVFSGCSPKQIDPQSLAQKIYTHYRQKKFMHFKLTEHYRYKGQIDTISTPYEAWLMRVESDKKLGGWAWVENYYRPYKIYYDLQNLYVIYPSKHKIRQYKKVFKPLITYGDWTDMFFHPDRLMRIIVDNPDNVRAGDTVIDGKDCYFLNIVTKPKKGYAKQIEQTYFLDKKEITPVKASSEVTYSNGDVFYNWVEFDDVNFDGFDTARFRKEFEKYAAQFPPIPYDPSKPEEIIDKMLKIGSQAPDITGTDYVTGETFRLSDYRGKVVLLDFWYTHCPPCVKAIPELSKLYGQYHDKGLEIFGLNSIDPADEAFFKFIKNIGMKYPAIKTESAVDRTYKIIAYPSMYLIDRNGVIRYIEVGFTKESFEKLKAEVEKLLEQ